MIQPGERHWEIYRDLCQSSRATGSLTQDAWLAALAIEHGCEWVTTDDDDRRFPGLRWRRPFGKRAGTRIPSQGGREGRGGTSRRTRAEAGSQLLAIHTRAP